jgi:hypothetical protein
MLPRDHPAQLVLRAKLDQEESQVSLDQSVLPVQQDPRAHKDLQAREELVIVIFAPMLLLVMSLEFWSSIILEDKPKSLLVLDREET